MNILVCVKRVPITGGKMVLTADEQALETRHLGFTISPHEECAVEEAVRIVEAGGEGVGRPDARTARRRSRCAMHGVGADGHHLKTDGTDARAGDERGDRRCSQRAGPFDLILFGNESADSGTTRWIRVAYALELPVVTGLKAIEVQGDKVRCERDVGGARDVYEVPMPAVLTALEGLNLPRYPSVPGRLRAKSKPLAVVEPARPESKLEKLGLIVPEDRASGGDPRHGPDAAPKVVEVMQQLGVA